jgi:nicotinamide phosphoribosyltransferase
MKTTNTLSLATSSALADLGFATVDELITSVTKSFISFANPLLATDVYKMGHMEQYKKGTTKVFAYLYARSDRTYKHMVIVGFQHLLTTYLARRITKKMGREFLKNKEAILGLAKATDGTVSDAEKKIMALCELGYIPLEIKAVPEGTVIPAKNVVATVTNTIPEFYWCVGFFESLILKVWDAISTASCSFRYRQLVEKYFDETVDKELYFLKDFMVHDFGYRGSKTEEEASITGVAHLLSFAGSDTVPAREYAIRMYGADENSLIMGSVPASEHSVACSFGLSEEGELAYLNNMLDLYPTGIVSIVSDTSNIYTMVTDRASVLKEKILSRPEGSKVVFRPDSGNPEYVLCGDPNAPEGSREWKGVFRLLEETFGSFVNTKGFKVLHPKVGVIYGDGMYLERYTNVLNRMKSMGFASNNLVIGVGGILRNHSRDTLGFSQKAVYAEIGGVPVELQKDPITDARKKSHKGLVALVIVNGEYRTIDQCTPEQEAASLLQVVFRDGKVVNPPLFAHMKVRVAEGLERFKV